LTIPDKNCIFTLKPNGLASRLMPALVAALSFSIVVLLFQREVLIIVIFGFCALLTIFWPYVFGVHGYKIQFYDDKMKLVDRKGRVKLELKYSEILRIGDEQYSYRMGYSLYGEGDRLLTIIPSNPKLKEFDNRRLLDWLSARIGRKI